MCIYIYALHIHSRIYTYIYTCIYLHIFAFTFLSSWCLMHIYKCIYINSCLQIHVFFFYCLFFCFGGIYLLWIHIYIYVYIYMYVCIYLYIKKGEFLWKKHFWKKFTSRRLKKEEYRKKTFENWKNWQKRKKDLRKSDDSLFVASSICTR